MYVSVSKVCVNVSKKCVNVSNVCVNVSKVCVNVCKVCVNVSKVCVNIFNNFFHLSSKQHAERMQQVFEDIQGMYVRLMSALVLECENHLGRPPCDYTVMALGSVARIEATPYSDLEFAILHAGSFEDIHYFRVLCYLLQMKVINLGETILPSLAIKELNNFQSKKPSDNWFYDSATPRGISFDGAMPWASKTPLGRLATERNQL